MARLPPLLHEHINMLGQYSYSVVRWSKSATDHEAKMELLGERLQEPARL